MVETMDYSLLQQLGLKFNLRRDNYEEILEKIKEHQKEEESKSTGTMKINRKTFQDIKRKLLPNSKIAAVDFISICNKIPSTYSEIKHDLKRDWACQDNILEAYSKSSLKSHQCFKHRWWLRTLEWHNRRRIIATA